MSEKKPPPKIKIYTKGYCGWCHQVLRYLDELGWEYEEVEVTSNPKKFQELIDVSGQDMTPTAFIDGKLLRDFGRKELEEFLRAGGYLSE